MRLKAVTQIKGSEIVYHCIKCSIGFAEFGFADLDGKAFVDYYCRTCAEELGAVKPTDPSESVYRKEESCTD